MATEGFLGHDKVYSIHCLKCWCVIGVSIIDLNHNLMYCLQCANEVQKELETKLKEKETK